jgi:DNA polymerase sigma
VKKEVCSSLQAIVRRVVPNAELKIMGGAANTFALKDCDVDVCIVTSM